MNTMLTNIVTIVKETHAKIWNSIVSAVTRVATWGNNMLTKAKEVMNAMVTGVITIVKELPQKIWNSIVGCLLYTSSGRAGKSKSTASFP